MKKYILIITLIMSLFSTSTTANYDKLVYEFSFNDLDGSKLKLSDYKDKVIVIVNVERRIMHPVYKKIIKRSKKFSAHDEGNKCKAGQTVKIRECAPKSKNKTWEVIDSVV